ncbi:MAG: hypothetical protein ACR5LF_07670 [Symbiopectobacterium sp.]
MLFVSQGESERVTSCCRGFPLRRTAMRRLPYSHYVTLFLLRSHQEHRSVMIRFTVVGNRQITRQFVDAAHETGNQREDGSLVIDRLSECQQVSLVPRNGQRIDLSQPSTSTACCMKWKQQHAV